MSDVKNGYFGDNERTIIELLPTDHHIAMVMTMVGREHSSRPVTCVEVTEHRMSFLVSRDADWVRAITERDAVVHITVADDARGVYVAINGAAIVVHDVAEIQRLWSPACSAYFDGPDDPGASVMHFDVSGGEYWDGPSGRVGRTLALIRAALTGDEIPSAHGIVAADA